MESKENQIIRRDFTLEDKTITDKKSEEVNHPKPIQRLKKTF